MEASLANFRPSDDSRLHSLSGVMSQNQVPKSGPFSSVLDLGGDSPCNGKPYPEIEFFSGISDYSNQGTVGTPQDIRSSVDYSYFLGQSIASPHATALPPSSGNFIAPGGSSMVTPPSGGGSILLPTHEQKRSVTHASLKGDFAGSGLLRRNKLKARSSPSRKLAEVNSIRKPRKESYRVSQLIEAFPLIGKLKDVLKAYPSCAMAISLLEESMGETMAQESRASRSSLSTHMRPLNIESGNYSLVDLSDCSNSTSISTAPDFSWPSQDDSSMTFPSSGSIPNMDFMDLTMDNETPRVRTSNTTIYHCTVPVDGILCKFSTNSKGDWVRHEESDKHWPQKRYMCKNCIDLIKDEEGNSLCAFCLQRLPPIGSKTHYLQCQKAQRGKHVFNGARKDHFRNHLKTHGIADITSEASTWAFAVESDWHRQCGFCTQTFTNWDERIHHVAKHFQQGMDISSWIFPSLRRKRSNDYPPGINHGRDDNDDDDGDNDDSHNNRQKGRRTPTAWFSGQPFSRRADNSYPAEGWLGWTDGGLYDANAGPTSREKVEAYLKHQSQVESEAEDRRPSDTKSRNSRDYTTRVDLLRDMDNWVDGQDSQRIFWLSGSTGKGKSTIAPRLLEQRHLGASFFFSRGCGDALETFWKYKENLPHPSRDILHNQIQDLPRKPSLWHVLVHFNELPPMTHYMLGPDGTSFTSKVSFLRAAMRRARTENIQEDRCIYSNGNYVLIGIWIEAMAGEPLKSVIEEHLFHTLGMTRTFLEAPSPSVTGIAPPYIMSVDGCRVPAKTMLYKVGDTVNAALGGYSCYRDLAILFRKLLTCINDDYGTIFDRDTIRHYLIHRETLDNKTEDAFTIYGIRTTLDSSLLGGMSPNRLVLKDICSIYRLGTRKNGKLVPAYYLAGHIEGYSSSYYFIPKYSAFYIVLTNSTVFHNASDYISRLLLQGIFDLEHH